MLLCHRARIFIEDENTCAQAQRAQRKIFTITNKFVISNDLSNEEVKNDYQESMTSRTETHLEVYFRKVTVEQQTYMPDFLNTFVYHNTHLFFLCPFSG
mmetsp:Transcript_44586/g.45087  ORF Transcript_44586/g.45087 Transcript_44586/m.45087 type:complete len:99 (-) Transcript_44586:177-473(-)